MSVEFVCQRGRGAWPSLRHRFRHLVRMAPVGLLAAFILMTVTACTHHSSPSAPAITVQPVGGTVVSGRAFSFTVTATGTGPLSFQWSKDGNPVLGAQASTLTLYNPGLRDSGQYTVTISNSLGTTTSTPVALSVVAALAFPSPYGVTSDAAGNLYVSDVDNHVIWKVDPTNHKTLIAGTEGVPGFADGPGTTAQFRYPGGMAFDPSGDLLVADTGNDTIRVIAPDPASNNAITPNSVVSTLAGSPGQPGYADGQGANALFNAPIGLAVSSSGTIYIGDSQNHVIRQMTPSGTVSLYAGTPGKPGFQNGAAGSALFNQPNGLALKDDGTLLVADYGNSSIRSISPAGQVATLAGQGTHGFADGAPSSALFYWPVSIAVDATGVVWVADTSNHVIRKISADGSVLTIAGAGGTAGNLDGTGTAALFDFPCGIAVLPSGDLLVADTDNHYLRKVTTSGVVTTYLAP